MKRRLCLALVAFCLGAAEKPWIEVHPPGGHFTVKMPAAPVESHSEHSTAYASLTTHIFKCERPPASYTVTYTDLPALFAYSGQVVENTRKELLSDAGAEPVSYSDIPGGKELAYRTSKLQGWSQIFLVGKRLYVTDVKLSQGGSRARLAEPFLRSWRTGDS